MNCVYSTCAFLGPAASTCGAHTGKIRTFWIFPKLSETFGKRRGGHSDRDGAVLHRRPESGRSVAASLNGTHHCRKPSAAEADFQGQNLRMPRAASLIKHMSSVGHPV
eukprot:875291-Prorocentrum_minimum.AAC.6